ncbi:bacterial Ig-like domain-containing protein [Lactococcus fujiensis]|uniref:bacterial Ig-like domain-containing protein n=1 Tax=Lactococcus fujiensis TaxID=610251 RepID=UPI0006D04018|nr:bacterial Ig-like domain-containing protein [Lactococcus fujiensis]
MKSPNKALLIMGLACVFTTPLFASHSLADEITQSSATLSENLAITEQSNSSTETTESSTAPATSTTTESTEVPATSTSDTSTIDLATLNVKENITVVQNTTFENSIFFVSATDSSGKGLVVDDLNITGNVDTTKNGTYELKVTNGSLEKTIKVTVATDLTSLNLKSSVSVMQNSTFKNDMIFDSATDSLGNQLTLADLKITGTVDTSKAGNYTLTVANGSITKTITVTVKADLTTLNVKNVSLTQGSSFNYASFFVFATDSNGKALKVTDLKVTGSVTTGKIGTYTLTVTNGSLVKKSNGYSYCNSNQKK